MWGDRSDVEGRLTEANRFRPHLVHFDPRADSKDEMRAGDAAADGEYQIGHVCDDDDDDVCSIKT